jgi:ribosomal protein S18 acetylase RimI-like enzyme
MLVRTANAADAQKVAQIHVETWRTAYRGQVSDAVLDSQSVERRAAFWRERLTQAKGSVFVAENGDVIGFCDLVPSRDRDASQLVGEIVAIYVHFQHWRRGAGRALCDCALAEARRRGYEVVTLWSLASNSSARRFYEAMGFSLDGATKTEKASDGSELHEVRFRRRVA